MKETTEDDEQHEEVNQMTISMYDYKRWCITKTKHTQSYYAYVFFCL